MVRPAVECEGKCGDKVPKKERPSFFHYEKSHICRGKILVLEVKFTPT